ncbi:MAG: cytochrome P450, partial [Actinobacteria bacterium]|nr:cytochrome P450 [Actinomycetota bacterium]
MQPTAAQIQFDPFSRESWLDPYPTYRLLRQECPVYEGTSASQSFFALSRYADLLEYGRDWQTFSYRGGVDIDGSGQQIAAGNFLEVNPPEHGPLRKVVHQIFTPKAIRARLEDHLEESVSGIVADLRASRGGDLAAQLAWPVSIGTAGALLGFPPEDHAYLRDLSLAFMRRDLGSDQVPAAAVDASQAFREYFGSLIDARRSDPTADVLGHLATARLDEAQLPHEQAVGIAVLLYIGALDTTACLITNAFVHLASHQDQRAWLARNPGATPSAVEEVLRFDSPQLQFKRTT